MMQRAHTLGDGIGVDFVSRASTTVMGDNPMAGGHAGVNPMHQQNKREKAKSKPVKETSSGASFASFWRPSSKLDAQSPNQGEKKVEGEEEEEWSSSEDEDEDENRGRR
jgi:hypothetical protein